MHEPKIFCLMLSGSPIPEDVAEILQDNAHYMMAEGIYQQQLKMRRVQGVLETNLEPIEFLGKPGMVFRGRIGCGFSAATDVTFFVKMAEMDDEPEKGRWSGPVPVFIMRENHGQAN